MQIEVNMIGRDATHYPGYATIAISSESGKQAHGIRHDAISTTWALLGRTIYQAIFNLMP